MGDNPRSPCQTTIKPVYCPRRRQHDAECETPNACAGGIDCRLGHNLDSQRTEPRTARIELYQLRARYADLQDEKVELMRQATDVELEAMALSDRIAELEEQNAKA